jgi:hypothetical protein
MGELLVCGDSFGEFAGYRNHFTNSKFAKPILGGSWHLDFKHWCQLLADDVGLTAVSHAIGGAGPSSSSFVAFQQLLSTQYSGVVFFVSHQGRTLSNRALSIPEWQQHIQKHVLYDEGTPDQIYNPEQYPLYRPYKYHYHRSTRDTDINIPQIVHLNAEEMREDHDNIGNINPRELTEADTHYMLEKPGYSYTHDSVTAILALKALCDSQGIPLILASCFSGGICVAINNMNIDLKHFEFYELEHKHNFEARHDYPSHYSGEEHQIIYNEFKKQYPEYKDMFSQNN